MKAACSYVELYVYIVFSLYGRIGDRRQREYIKKNTERALSFPMRAGSGKRGGEEILYKGRAAGRRGGGGAGSCRRAGG